MSDKPKDEQTAARQAALHTAHNTALDLVGHENVCVIMVAEPGGTISMSADGSTDTMEHMFHRALQHINRPAIPLAMLASRPGMTKH